MARYGASSDQPAGPAGSSGPAPLPAERSEAGDPHGTRSEAVSRVVGAFAFAVALSLLVFPDAWLAMMRVWRNSETFTHGFIALPFAAWMIWSKRVQWSKRPVRSWWPGLLIVAGLGLAWIVGRLAGVASVEQLAAVAMIPATLVVLVGPPVTRALAFPLAFLFFAVPIGEFLTPIMMDYTADATVAALRWTGVPVYREGLFFTVPTGRWSVVEACSGLRYLIASLALGVLYAYLQFHTLRYRLAFIALAAIVPIVANWIRAYLIVMIGHLSDMRLAAGADHLIYGWLFFGLVMGLLFWIGSRMREPVAVTQTDMHGADQPVARSPSVGSQRIERSSVESPPVGLAPARRPIAAALAALMVALLARPMSAAMLDATEPVAIGSIVRAALGVPAAPLPAPNSGWAPTYTEPTDSVRAVVEAGDRSVEARVFYYARQHEGHEMIHNDHRVVSSSSVEWPVRASSFRDTSWGRVAEYLVGHSASGQLLIWHWYDVAGTITSNDYVAKGATALALLRGNGDHSLAVVLATPISSRNPEELDRARRALEAIGTRLAPTTAALSRGQGDPR